MDQNKTQLATVGGGCFWGVEHLFQQLEGVHDVVSGFMGGTTEDSTYYDVCSGTTGHAEVVQITFDPEIITYKELLHFFWEIHDPTTLNRQGPDIGTQYRSAIFYHSEEQKAVAIESKEWAGQFFSSPIITEINPASNFILAGAEHQDYFEKHGAHGCHIHRPLGR